MATRACERSGSGRISAHRSNPFLWLTIPAPFPAPRPPAPAPLPIQPIVFTPAHRSDPAHQIFGPLRSSSAPLLLQYVSSSKRKKWTDFYRASSYDSAVLAVVILYVCMSVCLSVCHTRVLWQNQTMHCGYFDTTRKGKNCHQQQLVGAPSVSNLRWKWLNPSKRTDLDRFLLITSQP